MREFYNIFPYFPLLLKFALGEVDEMRAHTVICFPAYFCIIYPTLPEGFDVLHVRF
jgi:ATP phosphoribosyltransferase regulatory subunit HisZ